MNNLRVSLLVLSLVAVSLAVMYEKVNGLGLPLLPGQLAPVWAIEARVEFEAARRAALVILDIPDELGDFSFVDEYFVSRGYGLNIEKKARDRSAEWSTRRASGRQRLYYRIEVSPVAEPKVRSPARAPPPPRAPEYEEPLGSAISDLLGDVRAESANVFTFVTQLLVRLNRESPDASASVVRGRLKPGTSDWVERVVYVLAGARIPARQVRGVVLRDQAGPQELLSWIEVHNGKRWEGFDPTSGDKGYPENFVRWSVGSDPLLTVEGGRDADVTFSLSRYAQSVTTVMREREVARGSWLSNTLLFDLPIATQNVFHVLLTVPLGALVVAFMRTIVGVPTLGTFMPVLIALSFRETELVWGLALFTFIVVSGLSIRFYMDRLQLLLVPRLCSVLVVVVLLMLAIALMSNALGFDIGFSIALFPIVILSMVIEHLSVVWEESGGAAAFREALGSVVVAILGFFVMTWDLLEHIVFLFPEVLLMVLAVYILIGRYTGYRLSELIRFRDLASVSR